MSLDLFDTKRKPISDNEQSRHWARQFRSYRFHLAERDFFSLIGAPKRPVPPAPPRRAPQSRSALDTALARTSVHDCRDLITTSWISCRG